VKACPLNAMTVHRGTRAVADEEKCVGCGRCAGACPASAIVNVAAVVAKNNKKDKRWYDYHDFSETAHLVRLLPDGHDDAWHL